MSSLPKMVSRGKEDISTLMNDDGILISNNKTIDRGKIAGICNSR